MLTCPFLSAVPRQLLRTQPQTLLKLGRMCPVMNGSRSHSGAAAVGVDVAASPPPPPKIPEAPNRCPFFASGKAQNLVPGDKLEVPLECPFHAILSKQGAAPKSTVCCREPAPFDYKSACANAVERKRRDYSYRVFRKVNRKGAAFPLAEEHTGGVKDVTVWCSNDYLGMSWHPRVQEAVTQAVKQHGVGSGGTRNISGNTIHHEALERELADWHGKPAALLFSSCYVANEATLYTLGQLLPDLVYYSDAGNHASMIHGVRTSRRQKQIWPHNNTKVLHRQLLQQPRSSPKIVVFESVHSMTGDICPLDDVLDTSARHGALTFLDEVHAVGMYGANGAGVSERDGRMQDVDIISGTLGKAIGNFGGYIAGDADIVDAVRSYAGGFIFTTSLPPTILAGARASLAILNSDEGRELRRRHQRSVRRLRSALLGNGVPAIDAPSHIIPVHVGDPRVATNISERMMAKHRAYIQAINYPTVARGDERLRLAPTPHHTDAMIDRLADQLAEAFEAECPQLLNAPVGRAAAA